LVENIFKEKKLRKIFNASGVEILQKTISYHNFLFRNILQNH